MRDAALEKAIKDAGGVAALGRALGLSSQAISQWDRCPVERVLAVETASSVSRYELRPDIYGDAPSGASPTDHSQDAAA